MARYDSAPRTLHSATPMPMDSQTPGPRLPNCSRTAQAIRQRTRRGATNTTRRRREIVTHVLDRRGCGLNEVQGGDNVD